MKGLQKIQKIGYEEENENAGKSVPDDVYQAVGWVDLFEVTKNNPIILDYTEKWGFAGDKL